MSRVNPMYARITQDNSAMRFICHADFYYFNFSSPSRVLRHKYD